MSKKKMEIPKNGLFKLPSSVRQTTTEENSNTAIPEKSENQESTNHTDTDTDWKPTIISVEGISESKHPSTTILKNSNTEVSNNSSIQVLENNTEVSSNQELLGYLDTKIPNNLDIGVSENLSTQVLETLSIDISKNYSTEQLEVQDTQVLNGQGTNNSKYQGSETLPKPQKNNRAKDDKKPARKQASVHLTGAALKALHLYAYEEGLEKSEVVEKALRKFIPKRYF